MENYLANYLGPDDVLIGSELDGTPSLNPVTKSRHHGWRWISSNFETQWQQFFTFCVVRNPWDVMVSAYFYLHKHGLISDEFPTFDQWIKHSDITGLDDWNLYADDRGPVVDQVLRYENLEKDLLSTCVPYNNELQHVWKKSGYRPNSHYRDFYDKQSRERVAAICGRAIEHFRYQF